MAHSKVGRWRAAVLVLVHLLIGVHIWHWLATGRSVTPVEPSEAGYLLDAGRLNAGVVLFGTLILGTLVFGRWFCGWACHLVALQDLCAWLLGRAGLKPRPVRSRLLVLVPFAVAFEMFFRGQLERWWNGVPNPAIESSFTTADLWERFPGPIMGVATVVLVGGLIVWWLGAKGFCTYGCPYGAFFGLADRLAPMRIRVTDACDACGHCTSVCTSNVRVHEEVARHGAIVDPGCMKCYDCVSVCPKDALYYGFGGIRPFASSQQRLQARADFTWGEELALVAVGLTAFFSLRGSWFGEYVPLLLAVGLAVITAVLALLGWRLLRRRDLAFQHTPFRQGGRFTAAGRLGAVAIGAWLLLVAHTAFVRWQVAAAGDAGTAVASWQVPDRRRVDLEALDARATAAMGWSLVVDPRLHFLRGMAQRDLAVLAGDETATGRHLAVAEAELRAVVAAVPRHGPALVALADLANARGDLDGAEQLLRAAVAADPGNAAAATRLQRLEAMRAQGAGGQQQK